MNVLVGVISPAAVWVIPRTFVDQLRRDFPQHTFLEAWDREAIRRLLPDADVAFTPFVDRDVFPSASRLRWVQSPAVGVGSLMFPELLASDGRHYQRARHPRACDCRARAGRDHRARATAAGCHPRTGRPSLGPGRARRRRRRSHAPRHAHGHRRARRDRRRARQNRRRRSDSRCLRSGGASISHGPRASMTSGRPTVYSNCLPRATSSSSPRLTRQTPSASSVTANSVR